MMERRRSRAPALLPLALLLWVTASGASAARVHYLEIEPNMEPVSKPLDEELNRGFSMPEAVPTIVDQAYGFQPEQIHLTYWGSPDKMAVSFVTADAQMPLGPPQLLLLPPFKAYVKYGLSNDTFDKNATCVTTSYIQDQYNWNKSPSYVSPYISHCLMTGLPAGARVWYMVGWPELDTWSPPFNFTTYNATENFPFVIGVIADLGTSFNASQTMRQLERTKPAPKLLLNMGDMSYADIYQPTGNQGMNPKEFRYKLGYQPRWDMLGRMLQNLTKCVPMMTTPGNHDVEPQPDGTVFASYTTRYPVPVDKDEVLTLLNKHSEGHPSPDNGLYYSFDVPGVAHFFALTSYIPNDTFSKDTQQYKWLEGDLAAVDRKRTPWLIAFFHAPIVTSYEDSFKQVECMRLTYEPLFYKYGVDLILNGHVHAYERSKPVYNYTLNPCGAVHITVGCSGKPGIETGSYALDTKFVDAQPQAPFCQDPKLLDKKPNPMQPLRCHTYQPDRGGFCWNKQPEFSAYREAAYGHGLLTLLDRGTAVWRFNRNNDHLRRPADSFVIRRAKNSPCPNRADIWP
ncbi:hypothetical protein Rsub_08371 [Raphidocelis subcapitata]|uniref:Purple acid phosphatase n=1 Tax=Raphidocelis subcapitata TaxID=307507 RepID=A0A2V0P770_9CHLO|nr:hypothetical protein Rsub_08371 [Raphidocelis subcapitata]|eukprot:GBF95409.1 hypothetical protein Rsub_08371 [Raphidocelis subcapitata]